MRSKEDLVKCAPIYDMVASFFEGDQEKIYLWFKTPNPLLGNLIPNDMMEIGQIDKLREFVECQLEGNSS